jgi:hypothetical protein
MQLEARRYLEDIRQATTRIALSIGYRIRYKRSVCSASPGPLEARPPGRQQLQEILDADHAIAVDVLGSAGVAPCA